MGGRVSGDSESRFAAYVEGLSTVIGHADRAGPLRDYCVGLIMPGERKSVEPMAAVTAPARTAAQHQSLLYFVGQSAWSDTEVLAKATSKAAWFRARMRLRFTVSTADASGGGFAFNFGKMSYRKVHQPEDRKRVV